MTEVAGKRVLITGGASGIGRQLADELAMRGANISLWDIDGAGLETAAAELNRHGTHIHTARCDLSSKADIKACAARMRDEELHVDVLINNAGIVSGGYLLDIDDEQIERTFAVNTLALFWMTREFLPDMINAGFGHVVTVASAGGLTGTAKQVDYSSSKFAAVGFDEALRVELHKMETPVVTTVVCPFYVDTGMFSGVKTRFPWLLPILSQDYVVKRVVRGIETNTRRLVMPRMVYSVFLMRLLPVSMMDGLMRFFGVSETMDDFKGRAPR